LKAEKTPFANKITGGMRLNTGRVLVREGVKLAASDQGRGERVQEGSTDV